MPDWFMNIITITSGHSDALFWGSPAGFFTMALIFICSLITIFSKRMNADAITVAYNWILVGVCVIAMFHVYENTTPKHQLQIMLVALAVKKAWDVYSVFKYKLDYRKRA